MEISELALFNSVSIAVIVAGIFISMGNKRNSKDMPIIIFTLIAVSTFGLVFITFFN